MIRPMHVTVALSDKRLWFCNGRRDHESCDSVPLSGFRGDAGEWPELRDALTALRSRFARPPGLRVSLVPPLVHIRGVHRRGLRSREIALLVSRDPARYFLNAMEPPCLTVLGGMGRQDALLIHSPEQVLNAICAAAAQAGWKLSAIVPAYFAWLIKAGQDGSHIAVIDLGVAKLVLRGARGMPVAARTILAPESGVDWSSTVPLERTESSSTSEVPPTALRLNLTAPSASESEAQPTEHALACAGQTAACVRAPWYARALLNSDMKRRHDRRLLRRAVLLASGGILALLLADSVRLVRVQRALHRVDRERIAVGTAAAEAGAARDRALSDNIAVRELLSDSTAPTAWSDVLARVAHALPQTAFLTRMAVSSDSLIIETRSPNPTAALEALMAIPGVSNVRIVRSSEDVLDGAGRRSVVISADVGHALGSD